MATQDQRNLRVPGYVLSKKLGRGRQAKVYKARVVMKQGGHVGGDDVAVKIVSGGDSRASWQGELFFLTRVQGHQNIVHLVESITCASDSRALVLELCDKDLYTLTSNRIFSEKDAADLMSGVLSALQHMHKLRIVHRDIKPDNIAMGRDGSARVLDFGIAAWLFDEVEMRRKCGTPGYMAPEVIDEKTYGTPVDIFGFGATLYFMLSYQHAFAIAAGTAEAILEKTKLGRLSFGHDFDHVGNDSRQLIVWCMHEDADLRPDASFALTCPPFSADILSAGEHVPMSFEEQLAAKTEVKIHPFPPALPREGPPRPAPRLRRACGLSTDNTALITMSDQRATSSGSEHSQICADAKV
eukprot:TRINITY_DN65483_c0_g1_i1.p1 TRINITY_DN65483_c0_g1~~TRINITY_DN65483_c0_g1_i1.p1  ORF type:complete len:362 (+),score=50.75 TRINITY_DN65483_c0_g1_i1:23-1087(+)